MRITSIKAVPISYRVPEGQNVRLGIGRAVSASGAREGHDR